MLTDEEGAVLFDLAPIISSAQGNVAREVFITAEWNRIVHPPPDGVAEGGLVTAHAWARVGTQGGGEG